MTRTPEEIAELNRVIKIIEEHRDGANIEELQLATQKYYSIKMVLTKRYEFQELFRNMRIALTKDVYPWHELPNDFTHCAVDGNGAAYAFRSKPRKCSEEKVWFTKTGDGINIDTFDGYKRGTVDWKDSLQMRPEGV